MVFRDREHAGRLLARRLSRYRGENPLVLALPRGGVPVAAEIARELRADLDIIIPRKIGAPCDPELAIGAVSPSGATMLNEPLLRTLRVPNEYVARAVAEARAEIQRRMELYRGVRRPPSIRGRTVILVDDGIATGYTMLVAVQGIKEAQPGRLVVAVPVAPPDSARTLEEAVDELVVLATPTPFFAVGQFYEVFDQVSDAEVREILEACRSSGLNGSGTDTPAGAD